ncbi:hypothetical protein QR680_014460 [Steinernema hermaphroditum]|uniref:Ubiquitin carboxyl-terminal hydrolase n=1 Tax=Steinernema hermaphroditum TaxID=289476 RepID=A0AA39IB50_9BILA|nr:hypothetical protein QR680_014460 [Steinernema hermaphroditum]
MKWLLGVLLVCFAILCIQTDAYPMSVFDCYWTGCSLDRFANPASFCRHDRSPIDWNYCDGSTINELHIMSARWLALESNPETITAFMEKIGVSNAECADVYGFDDELLAFLPQPHYALILCFPDTKANLIMAHEYEKLEKEGATIPEGVFFMKQKISNACGTFALFHSLANNADKIDLGNGSFRKWLDAAWKADVDERSELLANNEDLATAHESCAQQGETDVDMNDDIEHHFICYIHHNGRLLEVDSSQKFPRDCGSTTQETLIRDAGKVCQDVMNKLGNVSFSAMALIGK